MKRAFTLLAATLLALGLAAPALAQPPDHGHVLVQRPVVEFLQDGPLGPGPYLTGYRKCVDLAGGRQVPLSAHHAHVHQGTAGEMLFDRAGHAVIPTAPLTPVEDCAGLADSLPLFAGPPPPPPPE